METVRGVSSSAYSEKAARGSRRLRSSRSSSSSSAKSAPRRRRAPSAGRSRAKPQPRDPYPCWHRVSAGLILPVVPSPGRPCLVLPVLAGGAGQGVDQAVDPIPDLRRRRHLRGLPDPGDPDRVGQLRLNDGGVKRLGVARGKRAVNGFGRFLSLAPSGPASIATAARRSISPAPRVSPRQGSHPRRHAAHPPREWLAPRAPLSGSSAAGRSRRQAAARTRPAKG